MIIQEGIKESILKKLHEVKDPEIDSVSIIDLGMIHSVQAYEKSVVIEVLPTFVGCPALEIIKNNIHSAVKELQIGREIEVHYRYSPPWTSDRISEQGREKLKEFGIAPPPVFLEGEEMWRVNCPYCDSEYTTLENIFGPTACRSILYCKSCKNPFEAMKPISTLM